MRLRQWLCGLLHGHDAVLHVEKGRLSLLCTSCTWESPGWSVRPATCVVEPPDVPTAAIPAASFVGVVSRRGDHDASGLMGTNLRLVK
jgi:hypothetical protein